MCAGVCVCGGVGVGGVGGGGTQLIIGVLIRTAQCAYN